MKYSMDVLDDPEGKTLPFFASAKSCLVIDNPQTLMRVRNQESTNACATFVTTAVMYGAQVRKKGHAVPGSTQEYVDYASLFRRPKTAPPTGPYKIGKREQYSYKLTFNYATEVGVSPEHLYKWNGQCKFQECDGGVWDKVVESNGKVIEPAQKIFIKGKKKLANSEIDEYLRHQPLTGMIEVTGLFRNWKGEGIYRGESIGPDKADTIRHAVTLVGFGGEGDDAYYVCQNSYGLKWGYRGYFKVLRSLVSLKYAPILLDEDDAERSSNLEAGESSKLDVADVGCGQHLKRKFDDFFGV